MRRHTAGIQETGLDSVNLLDPRASRQLDKVREGRENCTSIGKEELELLCTFHFLLVPIIQGSLQSVSTITTVKAHRKWEKLRVAPLFLEMSVHLLWTPPCGGV